MLEGRKSL
jgi:hypothetical protein